MKLGIKLKKNQVVMLVALLVSVIVLFLVAYSLVPRIFVTLTKAAPATTVSLTDSYVIGEKILCRADGEDKCKVNVFLLDKNGKPVVGKSASMTGDATVDTLNQLSDKDGKVSFEISSKIEGQVDLQVEHQNVPLGSSVTVTFRN